MLENRRRSSVRASALAAAFALALVAGWHVAHGQTTTASLGLHGPVATVAEYREFPGTTDRQLQQTVAFRPDGTAEERVFYAYDFMDGSVRTRTVTTFDGAGLPLASVVFDATNEPVGQTVFRYDDQGRMTEQATYDAEGNETRRFAYERDAAGNVAVEEVYVRGSLDRRSEQTFDGQGRALEQRRFDGSGRLTEVRTYTEPGRVADFVEYGEDGEVERTGVLATGDHGTERWVIYDASGALESDIEWAYRDDGLVLERRMTTPDGVEVYRYEYAFDDRGNWIVTTSYEDLGDGPTVYEVRDREIAYR